MTLFETFPIGALETRARALLAHVEAASQREGLDGPSEAQHLSEVLMVIDCSRLLDTQHKEG